MKTTTALAVASASFISIVSAQTERDLDSHEHGSAILNIAIDEGMIFMELESPWNNLVGFEHKPDTPEQHSLIDNALALLNQPEQLFSFEGSTCTGTETIIESSIDADEEDHQQDDHKAHDDEHDKKHDDDAHGDEHGEKHDDDHDAHGEKDDGDHNEEHDDDNDAHGEKDDDDHNEEHDDDHDAHGEKDDDDHNEEHADHEEPSRHSALLVSFTFKCNNTAKISTINVNLLKQWSGFNDLDVQLIGPGGQALVELNQQQTSIDITAVQ